MRHLLYYGINLLEERTCIPIDNLMEMLTFNKGHSLKFHEGSRVQQTPEEGWRTYLPKRCGNNNKDEDNSPKTLNDKKISKSIIFHGSAVN